MRRILATALAVCLLLALLAGLWIVSAVFVGLQLLSLAGISKQIWVEQRKRQR